MSKQITGEKRCWIGLGGHDVEVRLGQTLIGRHDSCHIVLDDALASRRHAMLQFDGNTLTVEDLGSVNGVLVNGSRISSRVELGDGDQLRFGNQKMTVHMSSGKANRRSHRVGTETLTSATPLQDTLQPCGDEESTMVREGEALETLTAVANKVFAMGRGQDAERLLKSALNALLVRARNGATLPEDTMETAGNYAVRLAEATSRAAWIDYVFELYGATGRVLPGSVIERLYSAVRTVEGVNVMRLRDYISVIQSQQHTLGPSELFFVRRIEGLEKLATL